MGVVVEDHGSGLDPAMFFQPIPDIACWPGVGGSSMQGACLLQKEAQALLMGTPIDTSAGTRHTSSHSGAQHVPTDPSSVLSGMRAPLQQLCMAASLAPGCLPGALLLPATSASTTHTQQSFSMAPSYTPSQPPSSRGTAAAVALWPSNTRQQQQAHIVQQAALAAQGVCAALAAIQQQATATFQPALQQQQLSAGQRQALQQVRALGELRVRLQALVDHPSLDTTTCSSSSSSSSSTGREGAAGTCRRTQSSSSGVGAETTNTTTSSSSSGAACPDPILVSVVGAVRGLLQQHDAAVQVLAAGPSPAHQQQQGPEGRWPPAGAGTGAGAGAGAGAGGQGRRGATLLELAAGLKPLWGRLLELARLLGCLPTGAAVAAGGHSISSPAGSGSIRSSSKVAAAAGVCGGTWLPAWALPLPAAPAGGDAVGGKETGGSVVLQQWPEWAQGWVGTWGWAPGAWQVEGLPAGTQLLDSIYAELLHACSDRQPLLRALFAAAMQPSWAALTTWAYLPTLVVGDAPVKTDTSSPCSSSSSAAGIKTTTSSSSSEVVPQLPRFLFGIHPAVAMAGEQLRLLQRLCPATCNVVRELVELAQEEQQQLQLAVAGAASSLADSAADISGALLVAHAADGQLAASISSSGGGGGAALATLSVEQLRDMLPVLQVYQQQRQGAVERLLQQLAATQAGEGVAALAAALQRATGRRGEELTALQRTAEQQQERQRRQAALLGEQAAAAAAQKRRALAARQEERQAELQLLAAAVEQERAAALAEVGRELAALAATVGTTAAPITTNSSSGKHGADATAGPVGSAPEGGSSLVGVVASSGGAAQVLGVRDSSGSSRRSQAGDSAASVCIDDITIGVPAAADAAAGGAPGSPTHTTSSSSRYLTTQDGLQQGRRPPAGPAAAAGVAAASGAAAGAAKARRHWGRPQEPLPAAGLPSSLGAPTELAPQGIGSTQQPAGVVINLQQLAVGAAATGDEMTGGPAAGGGPRSSTGEGQQAAADIHAEGYGGQQQQQQEAAAAATHLAPGCNVESSPAATAAAASGAEAAAVSTVAAPLQTALEVVLVQPLLLQQHLTTVACWQLLLHQHHLLPRLVSLQQLFFQGAGDWAQGLALEVEQLRTQQCCRSRGATWRLEGAAAAAAAAGGDGVRGAAAAAGVTAVTAARALQAASHSSSVADSECLGWVELQVEPCRQLGGAWSGLSHGEPQTHGGTGGPSASSGAHRHRQQQQEEGGDGEGSSQGSLAWSNRLVLAAALPWPLGLVLTQQHLEQYSQVFSVLLLLRRVLCRLQACWQALHTKGPTAAAVGEDPGQQRAQLRQARHWIHLGLHSMSGLLSQLHLQVQGVVQEQFVAVVSSQPLSLAAMQAAHGRMAAAAAAACGLSEGASGCGGAGAGEATAAENPLAAQVERVVQCWELAERIHVMAADNSGDGSGGNSERGAGSGAGRWAAEGRAWRVLAEVGGQLEGAVLLQEASEQQ